VLSWSRGRDPTLAASSSSNSWLVSTPFEMNSASLPSDYLSLGCIARQLGKLGWHRQASRLPPRGLLVLRLLGEQ